MSDEEDRPPLFVPVVLTEEQATMAYNAIHLVYEGLPPLAKVQCAPLTQAMLGIGEAIEKARDKAEQNAG